MKALLVSILEVLTLYSARRKDLYLNPTHKLSRDSTNEVSETRSLTSTNSAQASSAQVAQRSKKKEKRSKTFFILGLGYYLLTIVYCLLII